MLSHKISAQDFFTILVPTALKQYPEKARELGGVLLFKVNGPGGGEWTVDCSSSTVSVTPGDSGRTQCQIEIESEDFYLMMRDPKCGPGLYFRGAVKISGSDPGMALRMRTLDEIARPRF